MRIMDKLRGLTTVLQHKKWVFAYVVLFAIYKMAMAKVVGGSDIALMVGGLVTVTLGASSFDKSVWRVPTENKIEISGKE